MPDVVSKSAFKARALELCRKVQESGRGLIITDRGEPVLKLVPYVEDPDRAGRLLRDSVVRYDAPLSAVAEEDWELGD